MDRVHNLLEQIQRRIEDLNKAERKVAEVILRNPQQATRFSIATLAQTAQVSEPTVNRFCRSFGVSGYPELKMQLAQSLASGAAYVMQVQPIEARHMHLGVHPRLAQQPFTQLRIEILRPVRQRSDRRAVAPRIQRRNNPATGPRGFAANSTGLQQ